MAGEHKVRIRWGRLFTADKTYSFATEAELRAFLLGVAEMDGYTGYSILGKNEELEDEEDET